MTDEQRIEQINWDYEPYIKQLQARIEELEAALRKIRGHEEGLMLGGCFYCCKISHEALTAHSINKT